MNRINRLKHHSKHTTMALPQTKADLLTVASKIATVQRKAQVRPMTEADIGQVGQLFHCVFRKGSSRVSADFEAYFRRVFFANPHYDPDFGSIVHEANDGSIDSVIAILPIRYQVNDKAIMGRLFSAFMAKPSHSGQRAAAELSLSLRATGDSFNFTDSASPISARYCKALGGKTLSVSGLSWCRIFSPIAYTTHSMTKRIPFTRHWNGVSIGRPFDRLFKKSNIAALIEVDDRYITRQIGRSEFIPATQSLLSQYGARPLWESSDIKWLLDMIDCNTSVGPLSMQTVTNAAGTVLGTFCYFSKPGQTANVLSLMAVKGYEQHVVEHMLRHLQEAGFAAAEGRAHPRTLDALSEQRAMFFRHKAHVCLHSQNPDILNAAAQHELYIGGLAGEDWSRLMTDF